MTIGLRKRAKIQNRLAFYNIANSCLTFFAAPCRMIGDWLAQMAHCTLVDLSRQGVTKLLRQIEMIETFVFSYSYVSNKRRATFILFEEIFQARRSYSRPYVYLFLKKIIENLGKNRKKVAIFSNFFV